MRWEFMVALVMAVPFIVFPMLLWFLWEAMNKGAARRREETDSD